MNKNHKAPSEPIDVEVEVAEVRPGAKRAPSASGKRPAKISRIEPGLSPDSPAAKVLAYVLDECITIPGTSIKIGIDPLLGLFPGIGDAISALLGTIILNDAARRGLPKWVLGRMAGNILLNATVGAVPIIGDIFSAFFKSNARNYALLQKYSDRADPEKPVDLQEVARLGKFFVIGTAIAAVALAFLGIYFLGEIF